MVLSRKRFSGSPPHGPRRGAAGALGVAAALAGGGVVGGGGAADEVAERGVRGGVAEGLGFVRALLFAVAAGEPRSGRRRRRRREFGVVGEAVPWHSTVDGAIGSHLRSRGPHNLLVRGESLSHFTLNFPNFW